MRVTENSHVKLTRNRSPPRAASTLPRRRLGPGMNSYKTQTDVDIGASPRRAEQPPERPSEFACLAVLPPFLLAGLATEARYRLRERLPIVLTSLLNRFARVVTSFPARPLAARESFRYARLGAQATVHPASAFPCHGRRLTRRAAPTT